nr:ribonuclease H-like domain-containing protein [Tanacetum cinerariifolium]
MSRDVLTVGSTMRIPLLYRGEYSQWVERFMNYLEEQMDRETMINSIKNGDQPLPRVTQVSIARTTSTEQPPLKDKAMLRHELTLEESQQGVSNDVLIFKVKQKVFSGEIVSLKSILWEIVNLDVEEEFTSFQDDAKYEHDLRANKTVGIGNQCNELYLFDVDNASKIVSNNCIASCFVSKTLWHQRIGHPADQVIDVLKTAFNLDSHSTFDHLCDTSNKAKQTREPFLLSDHKSTKIRQLVHDVFQKL